MCLSKSLCPRLSLPAATRLTPKLASREGQVPFKAGEVLPRGCSCVGGHRYPLCGVHLGIRNLLTPWRFLCGRAPTSAVYTDLSLSAWSSWRECVSLNRYVHVSPPLFLSLSPSLSLSLSPKTLSAGHLSPRTLLSCWRFPRLRHRFSLARRCSEGPS